MKAAHDVFLGEGVDSASLRAIARAAKTNIGMIYYYFPTKDDLFMGVVEDAYDGMLTQLTQAFDPALSTKERLLRAYQVLGQLDQNEREVAQIVVREMLNSTERRAQLIERFQRGHLPLIVRAIAEGMQSGEIDATLPLPVVMVCAVALGSVPQIALRVVGDQLPGNVPQGAGLAEQLVEILFRGVAAPRDVGGH